MLIEQFNTSKHIPLVLKLCVAHYFYEEVTATFYYAAEDCLHDLFHHMDATRCNYLLATMNNQELSPETRIEKLNTSVDIPLVVTLYAVHYSYRDLTATFYYAAEDYLCDLLQNIDATRCNCLLATIDGKFILPLKCLKDIPTTHHFAA